jgi:FlaA1/EpsC-like NDP-sugar epimerase
MINNEYINTSLNKLSQMDNLFDNSIRTKLKLFEIKILNIDETIKKLINENVETSHIISKYNNIDEEIMRLREQYEKFKTQIKEINNITEILQANKYLETLTKDIDELNSLKNKTNINVNKITKLNELKCKINNKIDILKILSDDETNEFDDILNFYIDEDKIDENEEDNEDKIDEN